MAYILRTCDENLRSYAGFQYPESGMVEAPDWDPTPMCGNGLHGLLNGDGVPHLLDWSEKSVWMVLKVPNNNIIDIGGKVKFQKGEVLFFGTRKEAVQFLEAKTQPNVIAGRTTINGEHYYHLPLVCTLRDLPTPWGQISELTVGGSLYLEGTPITSLPEGLTVGGHLYLEGTSIQIEQE